MVYMERSPPPTPSIENFSDVHLFHDCLFSGAVHPRDGIDVILKTIAHLHYHVLCLKNRKKGCYLSKLVDRKISQPIISQRG